MMASVIVESNRRIQCALPHLKLTIHQKCKESFMTCFNTGVNCSKSETLFKAINDKFVKDGMHW